MENKPVENTPLDVMQDMLDRLLEEYSYPDDLTLHKTIDVQSKFKFKTDPCFWKNLRNASTNKGFPKHTVTMLGPNPITQIHWSQSPFGFKNKFFWRLASKLRVHGLSMKYRYGLRSAGLYGFGWGYLVDVCKRHFINCLMNCDDDGTIYLLPQNSFMFDVL